MKKLSVLFLLGTMCLGVRGEAYATTLTEVSESCSHALLAPGKLGPKLHAAVIRIDISGEGEIEEDGDLGRVTVIKNGGFRSEMGSIST